MRVIDAGRDGFKLRLDESLKRLRMSQSALARRVSVKRQAVNAWVMGRRTPDLETTRKLAAIFGWPTAEMLSWFGIYEGQKQEDYSQPIDTSAESGDAVSKTSVTPPVSSPRHTGARPPDSESIPVPSLSHRALYDLLAQLPISEVESELLPDALARVRRMRARQEGTVEKSSGSSG